MRKGVRKVFKYKNVDNFAEKFLAFCRQRYIEQANVQRSVFGKVFVAFIQTSLYCSNMPNNQLNGSETNNIRYVAKQCNPSNCPKLRPFENIHLNIIHFKYL